MAGRAQNLSLEAVPLGQCGRCQSDLTKLCIVCDREIETKVLAGLIRKAKRLERENGRLKDELFNAVTQLQEMEG